MNEINNNISSIINRHKRTDKQIYIIVHAESERNSVREIRPTSIQMFAFLKQPSFHS